MFTLIRNLTRFCLKAVTGILTLVKQTGLQFEVKGKKLVIILKEEKENDKNST